MKLSFIATGLTAMLAAGSGMLFADGFVYQSISDPANPTFTQLLGINNSGTIVGFSGNPTSSGFILTLPNTFTVSNFPGSTSSMVTGINQNGDTVGIYVDTAGTTHGYTDIGGVFTTVDQPGTVFNQGLGINNALTTAGYSSATDPAGQTGQTAYTQAGGVFSNVNALLPANSNSQAVGINNAGDVVGFYMPTTTTSIGFLDIGGVITTIDPFGSTFTQALGINSQGEIVGFYTDASGNQFGYVDNNGVFSTVDPFGSTSVTVNGLNDQGQIVGFYVDGNDNTVGFLGTATPEPASAELLGAGLLACGGMLLRRKRCGA